MLSRGGIPLSEDSEIRKPDQDWFSKLLVNPRWRLWALAASVAGCLVGLGILIMIWRIWVPGLYENLVTEFSKQHWWLGALNAAGMALVVLASLAVVGIAFPPVTKVLQSYAADSARELNTRVAQARSAQDEVEDKLHEIERDDQSGLIQLVKYSRLQLEQYYVIGLHQTTQTFWFSITAMFLGFAVIMASVLPIVIPSMFTSREIALSPSVNIVVAVSGLIIEVIAALFLWMYRSSMAQLTYFYNRQMYLHNVLVCVRIASGMKSGDEVKGIDAKALIIGKMLDSTWTVDRPPAPDSHGLKDVISLMSGAGATSAPSKVG
jgi:hypothetical protein